MRREYRAGPHLRRGGGRPRDHLLAHARRLGFNTQDAEDLVQELYLRLPDLISSGKPIPDFFGYLVGCLHGLAANARARERRRARLLGRRPPPANMDPSPENQLMARLAAESILNRLPAADAELLRWRILEGRPIREIARCLDIPEGTVWSRLHGALTKARAMLAV